MLDASLQEQLKSLLAGLKAEYMLDIAVSPQHESREELLELLGAVAEASPASHRIACRVREGEQLAFSLLKNEEETGISFRGVPNGHEFSSLLLAILNCDGQGKNLPDEAICRRIRALKGPIRLTTYVSLTCTNCPDVVQSLNLMAILNPALSHTMVDGALYPDEAERLNIQAVPSVFADGQLLHVGKAGLGELLGKLENHYGVHAEEEQRKVPGKRYDVIVIGGGPSGSAAAIYSARKGLSVAVLAERAGGQVRETTGIENLISVPHTTGEQLAEDLKTHLQMYSVDLLEHRRVVEVAVSGQEKTVSVEGGESFTASAIIIATGASWRRMNVPGEAEYIGRGVAFCPHCDGPYYQGKRVAVVGGGNSGIEAAIDLAGICAEVTVLEFLDELKADHVLQEKARSLPNVTIFTSSQTTEIVGNGARVTGLRVKNRASGEERTIDLEGVFVQIGLSANSAAFRELVQTNRAGEIEIDTHCRTSQPGIYAAGDVTIVPYKQIIIAMGEGAKAALSAFEDRMRGVFL
jgi:alkyl hydroperoxide reductase subunit F